MSSENQFQLLTQRRFLPFFLTQLFGALNDNIYKNALLITIAFSNVEFLGFGAGVLANVASILFILPFFILSSTFGQLADKYEKSKSIRYIKCAEVAIMLAAILAIRSGDTLFLFAILLLLGIQSAAFGPIKYSMLPQHLSRTELTGGNGLVESGTFLAILIGTLLGGVLATNQTNYLVVLPVVLLGVAMAGLASSFMIPASPPAASDLDINWNPVSQTYRTFGYIANNRAILLSILGISWFWFYGSVLLTQIPNYTRMTLGGDGSVSTVILMVFSIGVGLGSTFCNKLSNGRIEPGLVPIGAFGLSAFTIHLFFANQSFNLEPVIGAGEFLSSPGNWRILMDIALVGISGGIYVVPLYAMVQNRAEPSHLSRVVSGSNILDAFFIVGSGLYAIGLISLGLTVPEMFLVTGLINIIVASYIFKQVPEFIFRLVAWMCIRTFYRLQHVDLSSVPDEGGCLLLTNNNNLRAGLVIASSVKRNTRFVIVNDLPETSLLASLFKISGAISITAESQTDLVPLKQELNNTLEKGHMICFLCSRPLDTDQGVQLIQQLAEGVPIVPLAITVSSKVSASKERIPENDELPGFWRGQLHLGSGRPQAGQVLAQDLSDSLDTLRKNMIQHSEKVVPAR